MFLELFFPQLCLIIISSVLVSLNSHIVFVENLSRTAAPNPTGPSWRSGSNLQCCSVEQKKHWEDVVRTDSQFPDPESNVVMMQGKNISRSTSLVHLHHQLTWWFLLQTWPGHSSRMKSQEDPFHISRAELYTDHLVPPAGTTSLFHHLVPLTGFTGWFHDLVPLAGSTTWLHWLVPLAGSTIWS